MANDRNWSRTVVIDFVFSFSLAEWIVIKSNHNYQFMAVYVKAASQKLGKSVGVGYVTLCMST